MLESDCDEVCWVCVLLCDVVGVEFVEGGFWIVDV